MRVSQIMTEAVTTIDAGEPLTKAARMMRDREVGLLPVVTKGSVLGVISDRDIVIRGLADDRDPATTAVRDVMSEQVVSCRLGADADKVGRLMSNHQVRRVVVVDEDDKPVGIVSLGDLASERDGDDKAGDVLEDVSDDQPGSSK